MIDSSTTVNGIKLYRRTAVAFILLVLLPFMLSMINLTFAQDWKVHFFPAAIILAVLIFGPKGGFIAGLSGSLYSALLLGNPYIIGGNVLFGIMTGVFYSKTNKIIFSVILAFICELPWLIATDYYFMHLPAEFIMKLVVVLLLADIFWAALIHSIRKPLRDYLC